MMVMISRLGRQTMVSPVRLISPVWMQTWSGQVASVTDMAPFWTTMVLEPPFQPLTVREVS